VNTPTKPDTDGKDLFSGVSVPAWPREPVEIPDAGTEDRIKIDLIKTDHSQLDAQYLEAVHDPMAEAPSSRDALQALLAFSVLHEQVRRRKVLAASKNSFDAAVPSSEFDAGELFVLDEVLQLVAERAVAITGADGLAIALAENDEIVLRASAGTVRPDVGQRIDRDSAFSGACFRSAQIINCDDTETDPRVNLQACRRLGARSMVAVPLCGRRRVIGVLEAFSTWPFAFNDSDMQNLSLLAELVVGALRPEDEDRFAASAQVAATKLEAAPPAPAPVPAPIVPKAVAPPAIVPPPSIRTEPAVATLETASEEDDTSAVAASILTEPAAVLDQAPEIETPFSAAPAHAVAEEEAETETERRGPGMLLLLVCIVIIAAFAGGMWWKLKTAQLGSAMVRTESISSKPASSNTPAINSNGNTASQPGANPASDATDDTMQPASSPATAQELSKFPRITGIRHWSSADSSTVVFDLEDQVQYEAHRLAGPERIYFDLHDTQLASDLVGKPIDIGDTLLGRVRVAQPVTGMTRVVLETKGNSNFSVSLEPNPYRLVVEVRKIGASPKEVVNLFPNAPPTAANRLAIVIPPPTQQDLQLRARMPKLRIAVDAGHGGWDLGTVGRRGLLEKDLVLEIAQRLGKLLETRLGADVILTRNDDNYIPLDERAEKANQAQADLFISVHANYSDLPSARGVETYYTSTFSAPNAKDADAHAGNPKTPVTNSQVTPSLTPADLHERIEQSRRLAASVQRSLYGTLSVQNPGLRDRGIKEAGFVVLTESAMPGILAEVSFVSSPTDEQKLRSDGYREQIAEALYKGIARYAASSRGVKVASAGK